MSRSAPVKRRLAAILAVDVVGYSRLMEADEAGTLARLKALRRELFAPTVAAHGGRIVKLLGDGALVEFPSVVNAVGCAIAVQEQMASRDDPEDRPLALRIGINAGDVLIEGDDVYGDGVNIAARLEALAVPGGICISQKVFDEIAGKIDARFTDVGAHQLKNITKPVHVYRWGGRVAPTVESASPEATLPLPAKPSVAVLPFTNMSKDPDQGFFADGIAEDIITELSKFRSLFVIARNSSFSFRGQSMDVRELSQELGVRYIVEGSVRRSGNRVRVTAQLSDAVARAHLWAERYDRDLDDIFAVQDEVTLAIVTAIEPTLGNLERERARRKPTARLDAWESYQRGLWHAYHFSRAESAASLSHFRRAIALDPDFAPGHAGLAYALFLMVMLGFTNDLESSIDEAKTAAQRAVMLDPDDAMAQATAGRVHQLLGEHDAAIVAYEKALALNPNYAGAHYGLAWTLIYSGRSEPGLTAVDEAIRLSPRDPMMWGFLTLKGFALLTIGRHEEALTWIRHALRQPNAGIRAHLFEVVALSHLNRPSDARQSLSRVYEIMPDFDMDYAQTVARMMHASSADRFIAGLRQAGVTD